MNNKSKNLSKITELILNRVYIRLTDDYILQNQGGLTHLIIGVARSHPVVQGITLFEQPNDNSNITFYYKRTQRYILQKVDDFIYGINQRKANETMATFVSLTQLKHIHKLLLGKEKSVPAYTVIILYVIYQLLPVQSYERPLCQDALDQIHSNIHLYYLHNTDDELARFFEDCFTLVIDAMKKNNDNLSIADFPGIPREHPHEDNILL